MSQARLRRTRFGQSRVKVFDFGPGRLERLHLYVHRIPRSDGAIKVRLVGQAYVACGAGNEHHPDVEAVSVNYPGNPDFADFELALNRDEDAATRLADELEDIALADWSDPCEDYEEEED